MVAHHTQKKHKDLYSNAVKLIHTQRGKKGMGTHESERIDSTKKKQQPKYEEEKKRN